VTQETADRGVSDYAYRYTAFRLEPDSPDSESYEFKIAVGATLRGALLNSARANAIYYVDRQNSSISAEKEVPAGSLLVRDDPIFEMYRLSALRLLDRVSDERVVVPLSDMLLYEADDNVRLAAVRILGNHRDEENARRALEVAGQSDASPELRRHATWLAQDDASRVDTITSIIRNSELTAAASWRRPPICRMTRGRESG
jgi:hypothetical protein